MQDNVLIGVITGAHGLNGEVRVKTFTAEPMNITKYGALKLDNNQSLSIAAARGVKNTDVIVRFQQILNRTAAESLRGQQLFINKDQLPAVEVGEFLQVDLIGLTVCDHDNQAIGVLRSIQNYGAGDILDIAVHEGPDLMAPFSDDAVLNIDLDKKLMTVNGMFLI